MRNACFRRSYCTIGSTCKCSSCHSRAKCATFHFVFVAMSIVQFQSAVRLTEPPVYILANAVRHNRQMPTFEASDLPTYEEAVDGKTDSWKSIEFDSRLNRWIPDIVFDIQLRASGIACWACSSALKSVPLCNVLFRYSLISIWLRTIFRIFATAFIQFNIWKGPRGAQTQCCLQKYTCLTSRN